MALLRRILILSHRYLGIPLSLVFIVWFASGIVMMYAGGMPSLAPQARIEKLAEVDLAAVELTAREAAERAGLVGPATQAVLLTVLDRPAYRFVSFGRATTVFADTGETLASVGVDRARVIAARFADVPVTQVHYLRAVTEPDQWTLTQQRDLPLHKLRVDDAARTEIYVSPQTAEVVLATTRQSRALAWAGTIPHWFYITPLRVNQPVWYWSVVIASVLGCLVAILGIVLAVTQFRRSKPFRLSKSVPYTGPMRWHYITGALFGFFALTWAFSGMLSLQPFPWNNVSGLGVRADVYSGGPLDLAQFPHVDAAAWNALMNGRAPKELELTRIQNEPYYVVRYTAGAGDPVRVSEHQYRAQDRAQANRLLVEADRVRVRREPFSTESLITRLENGVGNVPIAGYEMLSEYDAYYYSRTGQAPLPVLRVKFDDPQRTWYYVDPQMSRIVARAHRMNRLDRWLFNGLHSLDFAFWYNRRPLWDIALIVLSVGALITTGIGFWLGIRRMRRALVRLLRRGQGRGQGHEEGRDGLTEAKATPEA